MEAAQITMIPTVTAPAMTAGTNSAADPVSSSFGEMLGKSMQGQQEAGTQVPVAQGTGATKAVKQDLVSEAETLGADSRLAEMDPTIVSQMATVLEQLAALQLGTTVQQQLPGQFDQPVEVASASDISVSGMGQIATSTAGNQMVQCADAEPKAQERTTLKGTGLISPEVLTSSDTVLKVMSTANQAVSSDTALKVVPTANQAVSNDTAANQAVSNDTAANQTVSSDTTLKVVSTVNQVVSSDLPKETGITPATTATLPVFVANKTVANDRSIETGLVKPDVQISADQAVSPAPVTNQAVSRDVPKDTGMPAAAAATTTETLANQAVTSKLQANALKTSVTGQPVETLNQPDSNKLEKESSLQEVLSSTKAQSPPTAPETQKAAEAQIVPQELSSGTKNSAATAPQSVRFAQPADVIVAASDSGTQENFSSDSGSQSSQSMPKMAKSVAVPAETTQPGFWTEQVATSSTAGHQPINPQAGPQVATAVATVVSEPAHAVVAEQVGRQVLDRLASHEIKQGNDQISLKLSPENLGNLQVNLRMDNQRLNLEIVAENNGVRDAILQQKNELKETLARQNIQMDSFTVTTGSSGNSSQQSRDWRQMAAEQQLSRYASARNSSSSAGNFETPMQYFVPQYQSTLDVRF